MKIKGKEKWIEIALRQLSMQYYIEIMNGIGDKVDIFTNIANKNNNRIVTALCVTGVLHLSDMLTMRITKAKEDYEQQLKQLGWTFKHDEKIKYVT